MLNLDPQALKRRATYTRNGANRLLEREMSSLVTRMEMCAAYIAS